MTVFTSHRARRAVIGTSVLAVGSLLLAACSPTSGPSTGGDAAVAVNGCGVLANAMPPDSQEALNLLPSGAQQAFENFPYQVLPSKWSDFAGKDRPFKIGLSSMPVMNAYIKDAVDHLQDRVSELADAGVVDPQLLTGIMSDPATMTPNEQIQLYQQMVDQGADAILVIAMSGEAMADIVTQAGEKGVVTVGINSYIPSPYAINVEMNPGMQGMWPIAEAIKATGGTANALYVGGIQGETTEQSTNDTIAAITADCPAFDLVGTVYGNFSIAAAKQATMEFLSSHPGDINLVIQPGVMGPGIISAFIDSGRPVPTVVAAGAQAGDIAYWQENEANGYVNFGTAGNSTQTSEESLDVALRTLLGQKPKVNSISFPVLQIDADNLADYEWPGQGLDSPEQVANGPTGIYLSKSQSFIEQFFSDPAPLP